MTRRLLYALPVALALIAGCAAPQRDAVLIGDSTLYALPPIFAGFGGAQGSGGGSFTGGSLDTNTDLADDVLLAFGTGSDAILQWDTGPAVNVARLELATPFALEIIDKAQSGGDYGATGHQTTPTLILRSDEAPGANDEWLALYVDTVGRPSIVPGGGGDMRYYLHSSQSAYLTAYSANAAEIVVGGTFAQRWNNTGILTKLDNVYQDDVTLAFGAGSDAWQQGELTTLTDGAGTATTIFSVTMGDNTYCGMTISYTIEATDGTEYQAEHGNVLLAIVDDAGGVVADVNETGDTAQALSSGTLSSAWTAVTTDDGTIEAQCAVTSSLTTTTHQIRWHVVSCSATARALTVP